MCPNHIGWSEYLGRAQDGMPVHEWSALRLLGKKYVDWQGERLFAA